MHSTTQHENEVICSVAGYTTLTLLAISGQWLHSFLLHNSRFRKLPMHKLASYLRASKQSTLFLCFLHFGYVASIAHKDRSNICARQTDGVAMYNLTVDVIVKIVSDN